MNPRYKIHSEQAAAAFIAKGWNLSLAIYAEGIEEAYEFLMEKVSDDLVAPSSEDINSLTKVFRIDDCLSIQDRGLVISLGIAKKSGTKVSEGDQVIVIGEQNGNIFDVSMPISLNLKSEFVPILIRKACKEKVKIGYSVWLKTKMDNK